jgi:hypothetical protein
MITRLAKVGSFFASIKWWLIGGLGALAVLSVGTIIVYNKGYGNGEATGKAAIARYELQVRKLGDEVKLAQSKVTESVLVQYRDRIIEHEKIVYVNRDVIVNNVPEQHVLSKGWVYAHNQSALGRAIDPALAANTDPAMVTDRDALGTVDSNYAQCIANADRLDALQQWNREIEATSNPTNNR